jgi:hypothetical protein
VGRRTRVNGAAGTDVFTSVQALVSPFWFCTQFNATGQTKGEARLSSVRLKIQSKNITTKEGHTTTRSRAEFRQTIPASVTPFAPTSSLASKQAHVEFHSLPPHTWLSYLSMPSSTSTSKLGLKFHTTLHFQQMNGPSRFIWNNLSFQLGQVHLFQ